MILEGQHSERCGQFVCLGSTLKKTRSPEDWMPRPPERYAQKYFNV